MKYLIYNDISYLIHNKAKIIILLLLLPIFPLLLNIKSDIPMIQIIMISMGSNLTLNSYGIIEIIMYLFNLFWFLYLVSEIYTKDLSENLENIFLRVKPLKYIIKKNLFFIMITVCIKFMQYIPIIGLLIINKHQVLDYQLFKLIITDTSYILLIQYIFLGCYLIFILLKKNIPFLVTAVIMLIVVVPKNIWALVNYLYRIIVLLLFINVLICWLFLKYNRNIMEKI